MTKSSGNDFGVIVDTEASPIPASDRKMRNVIKLFVIEAIRFIITPNIIPIIKMNFRQKLLFILLMIDWSIIATNP